MHAWIGRIVETRWFVAHPLLIWLLRFFFRLVSHAWRERKRKRFYFLTLSLITMLRPLLLQVGWHSPSWRTKNFSGKRSKEKHHEATPYEREREIQSCAAALCSHVSEKREREDDCFRGRSSLFFFFSQEMSRDPVIVRIVPTRTPRHEWRNE